MIFIVSVKKIDFNGEILQQAVKSTFEKRRMHFDQTPVIFTTAFINSAEKERQWIAFKKRIRYQSEVDFATVMKSIRFFLDPICKNIIKNEVFYDYWSVKEQQWHK